MTKAVARCKKEDWRPGKNECKTGGRPPTFTEKQKKAMAATAMSLKRNIIRPTPARVRAKRPRSCLNPETGESASDWLIYQIFKTLCYDDTEDDPWIYLPTVTKDYSKRLRGDPWRIRGDPGGGDPWGSEGVIQGDPG